MCYPVLRNKSSAECLIYKITALQNRILFNTILSMALTTTAMALNAAPIANYDSVEAGIKDLNAQAML